MPGYKILKQTEDPSLLVVEYGYQMYIDTTVSLDARSLGTFDTEYNINEGDDLLLKKIPALSEVDAIKGRPTPDVGIRHLHVINLTKKDKIKELSTFLKFPYDFSSKKDTREVVIDSERGRVLDYTDKSYAIFTDLPEVISYLNEQKFLKFNPGLTGPGLVKKPGFIMAKASKGKDSIFKYMKSSTKEEILEGNGTSKLPPSDDGNTRLKVWGEETFIMETLEEIEETSNGYDVITTKDLDEGRQVIEIEIKNSL